MPPDSETPVAVKDQLPSGPLRRAPAGWQRFGRPALVLAACLLLAYGGYYAWRTWFGPDPANVSVVTAVAQRGNLEDAITATGMLQPKDFVDVGTQVSGQLKTLLVDVGAVVKAKQLLAEIDPSVYQSKVDGDQAQLLNQKAQLAEKEAQLALAELEFTRQQNLMREEATDRGRAANCRGGAEVGACPGEFNQGAAAANRVSAARGRGATLATPRSTRRSRTVVSQAAKQGQTLNANQQAPIIMRIADLATMTVEAQVSEADVPKLHVGMDVYFTTLGGDNRRYYGKLRQIMPTPTLVNNVVLYDALFDVANSNQTLMTQMTAQVFFVAASAKDAVLVPACRVTSGRVRSPHRRR